MNEHPPSASEDPAMPGDSEPTPGPTAARFRRLPRAGRVATAATSRTAGWMVAAALAGSLVTLLLVPNRTSQTTIVPFSRAAFAAPGGARSAVAGGIRSAVPGRRVTITLRPQAQIAAVPAGGQRAFRVITPRRQAFQGKAWVQAPGMMPACGFAGPGGLPPGVPPAYVRLGGSRHLIKGIIVRPGVRAGRPLMVQLPATKRFSWVPLPSRITRDAAIQVSPGRRALAGSGAFTFIAPGGPSCAVPEFRGPARTWWYAAPAPPRASWWIPAGPGR